MYPVVVVYQLLELQKSCDFRLKSGRFSFARAFVMDVPNWPQFVLFPYPVAGDYL